MFMQAYQLFKARAYGADAVLLIAAVLPNNDIDYLIAAARKLGLQCLVEVSLGSESSPVLYICTDDCLQDVWQTRQLPLHQMAFSKHINVTTPEMPLSFSLTAPDIVRAVAGLFCFMMGCVGVLPGTHSR